MYNKGTLGLADCYTIVMKIVRRFIIICKLTIITNILKYLKFDVLKEIDLLTFTFIHLI